MTRQLPAKVPGYLLRLQATYSRTGKELLGEIIGESKHFLIQDTNYDNWNGGTYGHDIKLFLPLDVLGKIELDAVADVGEAIRGDLNKLAASVENEYFHTVHLEMDDEADPHFRAATPFSSRRTTNPKAVSFWKPGFARVFISHRDHHKIAARDLAEALAAYGVSCFVAHDTIQPMSEWRAEIMKGLETMEIMLLFLTDDFEESCWTNQEVGYALGKGVPFISFKLGRKDPPGFASHVQALKGRIDNPAGSARGLFPLIADALGQRERLQEIVVRSFVGATHFADAKERFDRMHGVVTKLTEDQLALIVDGFFANDQLHGSAYLNNQNVRLKTFLEAATGEHFEILGREIKKVTPPSRRARAWDDMPF